MTETPQAFVAYSSRDSKLAELISIGVAKANRKVGKRIHYEPWEFNDIAGNPLVSPILEGIDRSEYVVADITYLNLNVVYEVGFAIGRSKRCFLVRHGSTEGDQRVAREVGIFDTLGYDSYTTDDALANSLSAYVDPTPMAIPPAIAWLAWECRIQWVHVDELGCDEELPACDEELPPTSFLGLKRVMNNSRRLMNNSRRTGDAPLQI